MVKKTGLLGIMLLGFSTLCWSSSEFYVGLGTGPGNANFKQRSHVFKDTVFSLTNFDVSDGTHLAGKGWFGSLFAGYGMRFALCGSDCEYFYLAAEANADARSVKFRSFNNEFVHENFNHTTYKMGRDLGISLLPGFFISECTLLYARLGVAKGKFKIATTDISLVNIHKDLSGFRYGLGIKQAISDCFDVRMDYSQTVYRRTSMTTFDPIGLTGKDTHIKPTAHKFELGVIYKF